MSNSGSIEENRFALAPEHERTSAGGAGRDLLRRVRPVVAGYRAARRAGVELRMYTHRVRAARRLRNDPAAATRFAAQATIGYRAPIAAAGDGPALVAALRELDIVHQDLGTVVRVGSQAGLEDALGAAAGAYPAGTSFLVAIPGLHEPTTAWRERLLAAALLHAAGLGPRVYDLLDLTAFGRHLPALAIAGAGDAVPDHEAREGAAAAILDLVRAKLLAAPAEGWDRAENFRESRAARPLFVRPDLLRAPSQQALLEQALADDAQRELHFGRDAALLGGRYLYQSVPAARQPGRRDTDRRWERIRDLLASQGESVEDRVVLDVGCNAGLMLAAALADGARWGVGWDLPGVVGHSTRLLGALGCTRADVRGVELHSGYDLLADVPEHVVSQLDESVVFYLAIRHHVGFLESLASIPWRVMVYEGGETESAERLEEVLGDLREVCDFRVATAIDFRDSETLPRPLAILIRE